MTMDAPPQANDPERLRAANRKTALVLLTIALVFFAGIIATKFMGGPTTGIGVVGAAVLLFLVVAIGRNLRSRQ
jgi:Na+/H+ antiporter NhaD/arsenite permease-like protein